MEGVLLALVGAAVGCLFAWVGLQGILALLPIFTFPDEADINLNIPVLAATLAIAVLTTFILLWLRHYPRREAISTNPQVRGRGNNGSRRGRLRNVLIVSEVALSLPVRPHGRWPVNAQKFLLAASH